MPISKTFLPDVNVWLALSSPRHVYSQTCSDWLNSIDSGSVAFCRISQLGLLRLLTNRSVMGNEVLSSRAAWRTYRTILSDERIAFIPEPFTLEPEWQKLTAHNKRAPNVWTAAYLCAFARAGGMQVVTLDRGMLSLASDAWLLK